MGNTHLFDMEVAQQSAGWLAELAKPAHTPETEEYGVSSLVFRASKPFHPTRLDDILSGFSKMDEYGQQDKEKNTTGAFKGVLRSKGQIWLANALAHPFMWHSAGYSFSLN